MQMMTDVLLTIKTQRLLQSYKVQTELVYLQNVQNALKNYKIWTGTGT